MSCSFSTFGKMYGFGVSSLKFREQGRTLLGHILCAPLSFQYEEMDRQTAGLEYDSRAIGRVLCRPYAGLTDCTPGCQGSR